MTATAASTCAADEVEYTDYYMFLSVDPRADYVRDIAALQPGQSLTYFNGADKKNNLLGRADGMPHNVVQIVANGTSGEGADGMVTWTLEDFWKTSLPNCAATILSLEGGRFTVLEKSRVYYERPVNGRP